MDDLIYFWALQVSSCWRDEYFSTTLHNVPYNVEEQLLCVSVCVFIYFISCSTIMNSSIGPFNTVIWEIFEIRFLFYL